MEWPILTTAQGGSSTHFHDDQIVRQGDGFGLRGPDTNTHVTGMHEHEMVTRA
jgi:hypothetical protein